MKYKKYIPYVLIGLLILGSFWMSPKSRNLEGAISSANADTGLVGYWSFEDATGTKATDFSGNGNTGTVSGTVSWVDGKRGKALLFDRNDDYVEATTTMDLNASGTVSLWFKPSALDITNSVLFSKGGEDVNAGRNGVFVAVRDKLSWHLASASAEQTVEISSSSFAIGTWYHVVLMWDGSNVVTYVNGAQIDSTSQTITPVTTVHPIRFGDIVSSGGNKRPFGGLIDEVRIYNRALSATEIAALYNSGAAKLSNSNNNGLIGYWSFEDATGTQVTDFSGGGSAGTLIGNAVSWVNGKRGKGLSFGGSDDYVNMGNVLDFERTDTRSFAFWVNVATSPSAAGIFFSKAGSASAYPGFDVGVRGDVAGDPLEFELRGSSASNWLTIRATPSAWDGNWHHIVMTYSGNSAPSGVKIYFDGVLLSNTTDSDTLASNITNTGSFVIGVFDETLLATDFTGLLDEFRIYNRVLDQTEVTALYNSGSVRVNAPNNNGLVGYWSMEDATGTQAGDFSGNGNNGTLNGNTSWVNGKRGKALTFDGSGDYVSITNNNILGLSVFTVCAWVKPTGSGSFPNIFSTFSGAVGWDFYMYGDYNAYIVGTSFATNGSTAFKEDGISFPGGQWTFLCAQQNGDSPSNIKTFVNAVENSGAGTGSGTRQSDAGNPIRIGDSGGGGYPFPGLIDEVRIYNRVLSAQEVSDLYNTGR